MILTTGVWWDLNTCPVPAGLDPGNVGRYIESSLRKYIDEPTPVTIFAVGNLEYISPEILEAISSSGILLRHTPFRNKSINSYLYLWRRCTPPPAKVLLISGDSSWFHPFYNSGYIVLRAFPDHLRPSLPAYMCDKEWDWETILKENLGALETTSKHILEDEEPTGFCDMCEIPSQNCNDFIKHLKSRKHKQQLLQWKKFINPNLTFPICELCEYTAFDDHNMNIHYNSDEHKQNERAAKESPHGTTQEERNVGVN